MEPTRDSSGEAAGQFGPRDLGPYEFQIGGVGDRIFLGTFD